MSEYSQEEMDALFVRLFGDWSNPKLHLSPKELAEIDQENKLMEALSKAKHYGKRDYTIKEEYARQVVRGSSRVEGKLLTWDCHTATGVVQRDVRTNVPYVQVMHNQTFLLVWINMLQFVGHIGQTHFELGKKKGWVSCQSN